MAIYLIDSNHLSETLNRVSVVRDRINRSRRSGHRFVTCIPVLCELEAGLLQLARLEDCRRRLARLLKLVRIRPLDSETSRHYGAFYLELRRKGRVLSQVDVMVAALARQHRLTILTTDRDFEALPDISTENWIV